MFINAIVNAGDVTLGDLLIFIDVTIVVISFENSLSILPYQPLKPYIGFFKMYISSFYYFFK